MPGIDEIVLLGIRTGIRLSRQIRKAYVEATIERELVLPLPDFNPEITVAAALNFFAGGGRDHLAAEPRMQALFDLADREDLPEEQAALFLSFYRECKLADDVSIGLVSGAQIGLSRQALCDLLTVRQWSRKSPFPSAAQRVVGTLIETGVDYLAETPGALDDRSAVGRAVKGFLQSIGDLNLAEADVETIARSLFVGALETIADNPDLWGGDDKTEALVAAVARGLMTNITSRISDLGGMDLSRREKIEDWGQLVLRSVLSDAGRVVLANPGTYLSIDDGDAQAMVGAVGNALLDVILEDEGVDFTALLSRDGLDRIVRAALDALAENPALIVGGSKGLQQLISEIAGTLADLPHVTSRDILPEVIALVLAKSARNADLLWPADQRNDPAKHLLVTATGEVLTIFSQSGWPPSCSKNQLLALLDTLLDEVAENPAWLIRASGGEQSWMGQAVAITLQVLKSAPAGRIGEETAMAVVGAAVQAVALRLDLLEMLDLDGVQQTALGAVLDTVVAITLGTDVDPRAVWVLARGEIFAAVTEAALNRMAEIGVTADNIGLLAQLLTETVVTLSNGLPWMVGGLLEAIGGIGDPTP